LDVCPIDYFYAALQHEADIGAARPAIKQKNAAMHKISKMRFRADQDRGPRDSAEGFVPESHHNPFCFFVFQ
jgi:hypothetical protein